jgi:hypothetical protein
MLNALTASQPALGQREHAFLLVQEIADEANYDRLTTNVKNLHTLCLSGNDKVRLIFSDETAASLSAKVFEGVDPRSKAMLLLLSESFFLPSTLRPGRPA